MGPAKEESVCCTGGEQTTIDPPRKRANAPRAIMASVVTAKPVAQPVAVVPAVVAAVPAGPDGIHPNTWNAGFCQYCCDCSICCAVFCCPCCVVGTNDKIINYGKFIGDPCCGGCGAMCCAYVLLSMLHLEFVIGCCVRGNIRKKYGIPGNAFMDCCLHLWCPLCATCQDYKEIELRNATA